MKMLGIVTVGVVRAPICRVHCAVIFAIAQLSCFNVYMYISWLKAGRHPVH